jgi:hypothetical protein
VLRGIHRERVRIDFLSYFFSCFLVMILNGGIHVVRLILTCMAWNHHCGFGWYLCILNVLLHDGFSLLRGDCVMLVGAIFVPRFMIDLVEISMKHVSGNCSIFIILHLFLSMSNSFRFL